MVDVVLSCCFAGIHVSTIEFEKDDGHNYHAEYAATASSLRGRNYGIPGTDDCRFSFLLLLRLSFLGSFALHFDEGTWAVDWVFAVLHLLKSVAALRICHACPLNLRNLC